MKRIKKWIYGLVTVGVAYISFGAVTLAKSSSVTTASADTANLISGGNFNDGDLSAWEQGWLSDSANQARTIELGALKMTNLAESSQLIEQEVGLTAGQTYTLYFDVKTENVDVGENSTTDEGIWAQIREGGSGTSATTVIAREGYLDGIDGEIGTRDWKTFTLDFTPTVTGAHSLGFYFYGATGTVWVDDVYLAAATASTLEYSDVNLDDNGDDGDLLSACVDANQESEVYSMRRSVEAINLDDEVSTVDANCILRGGTSAHVYDVENTSNTYEKYPASCLAQGAYYYSCACGESSKTATGAYFVAGELGEHLDFGFDHLCDVCGETVSSCVDTNDDCICDTCEQKMPITLNFKAANISLKDNIHIQYAVEIIGLTEEQKSNVRVLIWTTPQSEYVYGTHDEELTASMTATINYVKYPVFAYTGLSVRKMTDDVYACVYVPGAEATYSEPLKYSILEYAYAKLGKTDRSATNDKKLVAVINDMLEFGAAMQEYQNHNLDRLATDEYIYVRIENALFDDGVSSGLYKAGTELNVKAKHNYKAADTLPDYFTVNGDKITFTVPNETTVDKTSFIYYACGDSPMNDEDSVNVYPDPQTYDNDKDYVHKAVENLNENYVSITMSRTSSEYYGLNINMTGSSTGWNGGIIFSYTQDGAVIRVNSAGSSGTTLFVLDIPLNFAENKDGTLVYKWTAVMDGNVCAGLQLDMWYCVDGVYTKVGLQSITTDNGKWHYEEATKAFIFDYDIVSENMLAPDCTIISMHAQNAYRDADCDWTITDVTVWTIGDGYDYENDEFVGNDSNMDWDSWGGK